jgi:hypothetical protein
MSKALRGQGNTLWIAIVVSTVLVALVVLAATKVRLPRPVDLKTPKPATSEVAIIRADSTSGNTALLLQVELYDPRPLFLPTPINNSDPSLPTVMRREPGSAFKTIPPKPIFVEYEKLNIALPDPVAVPGTPAEALHTGETANPLFVLGRINYPYTPLPTRQAFLEVLLTKTGRTVLAAPLSALKPDSLPAVDWQPLEMVVAVETTGMVGEPSVTSGSGFEEVDNYFRAFIAKQFRLGARLPPGFYTLRIGP